MSFWKLVVDDQVCSDKEFQILAGFGKRQDDVIKQCIQTILTSL
jgi:hypothetical protein